MTSRHDCPRCSSASRRRFLTSAAGGIGGVALATLLREDGALAAATQFAPKAKSCIFIYMEGAPSQLDLFSYKPKLNQLDGQPPPAEFLANKRFAFIDPKTTRLLGTPRTFKQYGASGMYFSDLMPNLSRHADKICMLQTVGTSQFNHQPGQLMAQTGNNLEGHPSMGSWLTYGLGSVNKDLPGYVVLESGAGAQAGTTLWQSGFLPSTYSGVVFNSVGSAILDLPPPSGISAALERRGLDALKAANELHLQRAIDPEITSRIANYELSFRMQSAAPKLTDLSTETAALARYGANRTEPNIVVKPNQKPPNNGYKTFATHCLMARRMVEAGVRFVNLFTGSWDMHGNLNREMPYFAGMVDQPIAALIDDLDQRGLLKETLVVWGSEFGRTPLSQGALGPDVGRDHHPDAFAMFMVGGGVKGGTIHGKTDDLGFAAVENPVDISDVHATILRLFGFDHMQLTYPFHGVDQRLTPLTRTAQVMTEILA